MNKYDWNNSFPDTPKSFKNKVMVTLNSLPDEKGNDEMKNKKIYKRGSIKRKFVAALVATMVVGTTVFAAGKISSITSSSSIIPTYTAIPTVQQVKKDFKFTPKLVEKFDNGYIFAKGTTVNEKGADDKGNCIAKAKELNFTYTKGNDKLDLYMVNTKLGEKSDKEIVIGNHNGVELYYHSYANKCVPADYKLTEQDKKDKADGKYVFSYGSDKVKVSQVQYLNWAQDGINYSFTTIDSHLSKDELAKMAQQVIDTK